MSTETRMRGTIVSVPGELADVSLIYAVGPEGPFIAHASSMESGLLYCSGYLSHNNHVEKVDGSFTSGKLLQDPTHPNFAPPGPWDAGTHGTEIDVVDGKTISYSPNT